MKISDNINLKIEIIIMILLMTSITLFAKKDKQDTETVISYISFSELDDSTALVKPILDLNNEGCALIVVNCLDLEQLQFEGNVYKQEKEENFMHLWVLAGSKSITVSAQNMHPKTITYADYGYPILHEFTTYGLDLKIDKESVDLRYRNVEVVEERYHTVTDYHYDYKEIKTNYFLSYQFQYAFPLGINLGFCKKYGAYVFLNYIGTSTDWYKTEERYGDWDVTFWSIGGGLMSRLGQKLYLQVGAGVTMEDREEKFFTAGACLIFKSKISLGIGYYYNGASAHYQRNILLDGLTLQLGF